MHRLILAVPALLLALFMGAAQAHADPVDVPALDGFIQKTMREYGVPGAAVVVVADGKVILQKGYGVQRVGETAPVDPDTVFQIASCTKVFTAALLATYVDEGRLDWDRAVVDYLPALQMHDPYVTAHVTTRDFLSHRSGLPAFTGDILEKMGYSREEIVRRIRYFVLSCGFREKAGYSNPGIFLAGMVAQSLGGKSYEDLTRARLLEPMGLHRTGFRTGIVPRNANVASPHLPMASASPRPLDAFDDEIALGPAGEITSSAGDLGRFMLMHLGRGTLDGRRILKPETVDELFVPNMVDHPGIAELPPISTETGFGYGMAWGWFYYNGSKILEKGGARAGYRSIIVMVPEKKLGVAVLCNLNATAFPEAVRARVLEAYLGPASYDVQAAIRERQAKMDAFFRQATVRPKADPNVRPTLPLDSYVGTYDNPQYGPVSVIKRGGTLVWEAGPDKYGGPLHPVGGHAFTWSYPEGTNNIPDDVVFLVDGKGQVLELHTESFGTLVRRKGR